MKGKARNRVDIEGFSEDKEDLVLLEQQEHKKTGRLKKPQDLEDRNDSAFSSGQEEDVSKTKKPRLMEATKTSTECAGSHDSDSQMAQQATHDAAQV